MNVIYCDCFQNYHFSDVITIYITITTIMIISNQNEEDAAICAVEPGRMEDWIMRCAACWTGMYVFMYVCMYVCLFVCKYECILVIIFNFIEFAVAQCTSLSR